MKRLARAAFEKIQNSDLSEQTLAKYPKSVAGYYTHSATPEMIEADLLAL